MRTNHYYSQKLAALAFALSSLSATAATINQSINITSLNKTMSDGKTVTFWVFGSGSGSGTLPGPQIEVGVGDTLNVTLNVMGAPMEMAPYNGHTIHLHGADVATAEDGVPDTGASVMGDTYTWLPTAAMAGTYMYHCHVHTVKHLEMGMYGALVVRPKDAAGNFLNQITADAQTAYNYVQTLLFSSVDPTYHTATGDSTVFADYNPAYFLINGNEGKSASTPASTLAAAPSKKIAFRLIGLHSVNGTFNIKDAAGNTVPFTVWAEDGRQVTASSVTSLDISPGQRYDVIAATPATTGIWYPQFTYKKLRDNAAYATAYSKVTF